MAAEYQVLLLAILLFVKNYSVLFPGKKKFCFCWLVVFRKIGLGIYIHETLFVVESGSVRNVVQSPVIQHCSKYIH